MFTRKGQYALAKPLVSIIVPVYNAQARLAGCLESILAQKYHNLEVLVVNDGSRDDSLSILNSYAQKDKRLVVVDKENKGVSATRNLGMQLAKGEYLQFVDSDDRLDENATRLLVEKAQEHNADLVISHYCHVAGDKIGVYGFINHAGMMDQKAFALGLMEEPASFYYGVMWNKLYRAELIREHRIECSEELAWSEDFLFNLEYIRYAHRFVALKTPVYYYVRNDQGIVHTQIRPASIVKNKVQLFTYYRELYEELGLYEKYKPQIYKYLVAVSEHM